MNPRAKPYQRGMGKFSLIFFGGLLFAVLYAAYHIAPWFYYYWELQSHMDQMSKVAQMESEEEIRKRLLYYIKRYELPVDPHDLRVSKEGNHFKSSLEWSQTFSIPWRGEEVDIHTFEFRAETDQVF